MRVRLCAAGELEVGEVRRFEIEGGAIALVRCDSEFRALVDVCSHEDYPLSEGEVFADVCEIECLRHGSTFSLLDGSPQSLPATKAVKVVPIEVDGDEVFAVIT
ncbi:MAG TPA: non-heme iron oxygenase ferredoxin subunit [Acidimicrobiales bacterium]|nr:non-heme iron oxygenase ferredoxin subunit [Acidimicrobiales bacterium]